MKSPTGIRFSDKDYAMIARYASDNKISISEVVRQAIYSYIYPDYGKGYLSLFDLSLLDHECDMNLYFSQFLDDFSHAIEKSALIEEEPSWNFKKAGRWYYAFAAAAHKLADDNNLPVPSWCLKDEYFPDKEYYAFDSHDDDFKAYLRTSTPKEYRWRNLFLGPNILERK